MSILKRFFAKSDKKQSMRVYYTGTYNMDKVMAPWPHSMSKAAAPWSFRAW